MAGVRVGIPTQAHMKPFNFDKFKNEIKKCFQTFPGEEVIASIGAVYKKYNSSSDSEKKATVDQGFKDLLRTLLKDGGGLSAIEHLVDVSIDGVQQELCSTSLPFVLLSDLFDAVTIETCEKLFLFVENKVSVWKLELFYNSGKNYLLRMCNDLLRRLSRTQHTVFCGRIQLFLARLFPLTEKSGLNLMSQFNLENITLFTTKSEDYDLARKAGDTVREEPTEMEEGEMEEISSTIPIDYNLYRKFWTLQDYFRKPQQCFEKISWKTFTNFADEVLNCFGSFKLDDMKSSRKKPDIVALHKHAFFAKYLTSEKLLDLQLSDGNFRRYVLVQFLILFQYLGAPVKFKAVTQVLSEEQNTWAKQTQETVMNLLKETPPEGEKFAAAIEHILNREENWNRWKNDSCPSYVKLRSPEEQVDMPSKPRKRSLGDDLKACGAKVTKMGNAELTRLWNLAPDNMAACRDEKRNTLPKLETFFEDALEQMDPEAQVEDEYKLINNKSFGWRALRVLARKSPQFFVAPPTPAPPGTGANQQKMLPQYLKHILSKMVKDLQPSSTADQDTEKTDLEDEEGEEADKLDSPEINEKDKLTDNVSKQDLSLSKDTLNRTAETLAGDWKKLAVELKFDEELVTYVEQEKIDVTAKARNFLALWTENEGEKATKEVLASALKEIGLTSVANEILA